MYVVLQGSIQSKFAKRGYSGILTHFIIYLYELPEIHGGKFNLPPPPEKKLN